MDSGVFAREQKRQEEKNTALIAQDGTENPITIWKELGEVMTEHVTVSPITPKLGFSQQGGMLKLSWPQSAIDYMVETTSSLNPPNWQPANLPVSALAGTYQANASVGANNQFFRLHQH